MVIKIKFNIIGTWEIIYKKIIFILILLISVLSIYWYLTSGEIRKSDTGYIISILYALFLFLIGVYSNHMKNKIDEKFYERKKYYLNLLKLKDVFNNMKFENYSEKDILEAIICFKGFTGRTDNFKNVQPYISQQGFKFSNKELNIEDEFLRSRSILIDELNKRIINYIDKNSLSKKYPYTRIEQVYFSVEEWCNKYITSNDKELKDMENYIYKVFLELQKEMDRLQIIMKKVSKKYKTYKLQVEWNIKTIENIYGAKLKYEFSQEDRFINEIRINRELIEEMSRSMCTEDNLLDVTSEINDSMLSIYNKLETLENNLGEIDTVEY